MKKIIVFALIFFAPSILQSDGIFLWQYNNDGHSSCCLHIGNVDICNPDVPCTRTPFVDLTGITQYVDRILSMEKAATFSFYDFLKQSKIYIQRSWGRSLSYRYDYYISNLKFYHELALEAATASKTDKNKSSATTTAATTTDKAKQEEATLKYLMKLGLVKEIKKERKYKKKSL